MELLTVAEVAKILRCNKNFVYKLNQAGLLRFMKLGALKCTEASVQDFLQKYDGFDVTNPFEVKKL